MCKKKIYEITRIWNRSTNSIDECSDRLAVEEPLEIRMLFGPNDRRRTKSLSITMRTPGNDFDLVAGFLVSENIIQKRSHLQTMRFIGPYNENFRVFSNYSLGSQSFKPEIPTEIERAVTKKIRFPDFFPNQQLCADREEAYSLQAHPPSNIVEVELISTLDFDTSLLQRNFFLTSSCGICGKASIDAILSQIKSPIPTSATASTQTAISKILIHRLPQILKEKQKLFGLTGGVHAAGLISVWGEWIDLQEDVGRHNAVDKLIGSQLINNRHDHENFALTDTALILSGRASFELLQKSLLARIPIVIAVGAPSSLAVDLAREFNMTLIGFASEHKFNVYTGGHRIREDE